MTDPHATDEPLSTDDPPSDDPPSTDDSSVEPPSIDPPRVLVLLHGYDDDVTTLETLRRRLDPSGTASVVTPVGPVSTENGRPAWWAGEADDPDAVAAAVAVVHDALRAEGDPATVALAGFSQGAAVALAAAFHPDAPGPLRSLHLFACFAVAPDVTAYDFSTAPTHGVEVVHGEDDDAVPVQLGRGVARLLERKHVAHAMITVPGVGHVLADLADLADLGDLARPPVEARP